MAAVKTRNTATLMTEGSIVKSLLLFALPLIFGNLLQQMYNTADSIIVGNLWAVMPLPLWAPVVRPSICSSASVRDWP